MRLVRVFPVNWVAFSLLQIVGRNSRTPARSALPAIAIDIGVVWSELVARWAMCSEHAAIIQQNGDLT